MRKTMKPRRLFVIFHVVDDLLNGLFDGTFFPPQ